MAYLPWIDGKTRQTVATEVFGGINRSMRAEDGEFADTYNMGSGCYPLMSQRKSRGLIKQLTNPAGMTGKEHLCYVDGDKLYYNNEEVEGLTLSTGDTPKQLISMGAYVIIWPDAVYFNTADPADKGSINAKYESAEGTSVSLALCRMDGSDYENVVIGTEAPEDPENNAYWLDTTVEGHGLKVYSTATGMWSTILTVYIRIEAPGIGKGFAIDDGVEVSGLTYTGDNETLKEQIESLNTTHLIYDVKDDYIVVVGLIDNAHEQTASITVKREAPKMDYITESENRLWGCYYGKDEKGETLNEIYACRLGDFKNWRSYAGVSMDSYTVSIGSDGPFTGAITYGGYPTFFKEKCLHKIYGTRPANYQVMSTQCRGVQQGSAKSLQIVEGTLFYKSPTDIVSYDGSLPVCMSRKLGDVNTINAVAGTLRERYYISMQDAKTLEWSMYVYDAVRGIWHKEDDTQAVAFTEHDGDLYCLDKVGNLFTVNGTQGEAEGPFEWSATSGLMGYEYEEHKSTARYNIRAQIASGAWAQLEIEYDSDGIWHNCGTMRGVKRETRTFLLPVRPRRCDHWRVRLRGKGEVKIYSIYRKLANGGDGQSGWR